MFAHIPPVNCTTSINLNTQDKNGFTALHHFVNALPFGVYESLEIIRYLHDGGISLDIQDTQGKTALDYVKHTSVFLTRALQQLQGEVENLTQMENNTEVENLTEMENNTEMENLTEMENNMEVVRFIVH